MYPVIRAVWLAAILSLGSAQAAEPVKIPDVQHGSIIAQGMASFYADKFQGRRTASGEPMDQNDFTAASGTLPFGTHVRVTNLQTGKSVLVRINDRGPHAPGRIIDLSRRAARAVDITARSGVARVRLEVRPGDQPTPELRRKIAARVRAR